MFIGESLLNYSILYAETELLLYKSHLVMYSFPLQWPASSPGTLQGVPLKTQASIIIKPLNQLRVLPIPV